MSTLEKPPASAAHAAPAAPVARPHSGPVEWHHLVRWLHADGVISATEAQRTTARCSQAESAQNALVRLASVAMERLSDGKAIDIEMLTEYLARRAGLEYLRIDPLRVDVGRVADTMSAVYAERHKVLPVQVSAKEVVVATAEPFITDWVAEVERQARRPVRRVVANPQDIHRFTAEFFALAKSVRAAQKAGGSNSKCGVERRSVTIYRPNGQRSGCYGQVIGLRYCSTYTISDGYRKTGGACRAWHPTHNASWRKRKACRQSACSDAISIGQCATSPT